MSVNDGVTAEDYVISERVIFCFSSHPRAFRKKGSNAKANNKAANFNHKNISLSRASISENVVVVRWKEIERAAEILLGSRAHSTTNISDDPNLNVSQRHFTNSSAHFLPFFRCSFNRKQDSRI